MSDHPAIEPIQVIAHIKSSDVSLDGAAPRLRTSYETFVLTANDPAQCILPEDDRRVCAYVQAIDNDIVLGPTKAVVNNPVNTVANVPQPNGAYVPKANTAPYPVYDSNAVYAGITITASNSRVTVVATYRER
jgi:hypothetical protein